MSVSMVEELEGRFLLAFAAHVNFQPAGRPVPAGYVADTGSAYGSRGGGLTYGWNKANNTARDRDSRRSPDQRYDTLLHMQYRKAVYSWEIAVPKGTYEVRVVAGDAADANSIYRINVEGVLTVNGTPTAKSRWVSARKTIKVSDGRLAVTNAVGARNNKIDFIDIQQVDVTPARPEVTVAAIDKNAAEAGKDAGIFRVTRSGGTGSALTVSYQLSGSATSGSDYDALPGTITIPAGKSSADITLHPKNDTAVEGSEGVTLTLAPKSTYIVRGSSATVTIADNDSNPKPTNHAPSAPRISEPATEGLVINGADVHMEILPIQDADGDNHLNTDWEIWTSGASPQRVWKALAVTDSVLRHHIHLGDGTFEGAQAGQHKLKAATNYELRVRVRDDSGAANNTSAVAVRHFKTAADEAPTADGWVVQQPGYKVEEVPFKFPAGEGDWRLPTNIAFVPQSIRGHDPADPLFYVTELYGSIRVVTNDYTVHTYASGVLNYNPFGPFGGTGENGLTGIAVDPSNGDIYATMLYDDLNDSSTDVFPKVTRYTSEDGGITAVDTKPGEAGTQGTDILKMPGEDMRQSHIIGNITFGPDNKLWVHVGEGFESAAARNDNRFKGKILHINRDGSPSSDNPNYNAGDGITARDYWWAKGLRNPFGGAWREATATRAAQHWTVENGPGLDRMSLLVKGRDYLWDDSETSMRNYNVAYSPTGTFEGGVEDWKPAPAPVNIAFVQKSTFDGSGFPDAKLGHAFVSLSGPTHAAGPNFSKSIQEWVLDDAGNRVGAPRELISYEGAGYETAAALAAGPDGLYFSTLYPDTDPAPTNRGARILRVVYTGGN